MKLRAIFFGFLIFQVAVCYKPVVLLHGILTGSYTMEIIKNKIEELHPGTIVYNMEGYGGWTSLENMWHQVLDLGEELMNITKQHPEGIHFLGYSQGALLARAILQTYPNHNVHNFISLSGPQAGQFGVAFLHLIFPTIALDTAYELFYSRLGQHTSVGNYWNDPHHQVLYYDYSQFLPYVNNALMSNSSQDFKMGLTKLKKMVLIGGPDDGIISPWQSSQFGFYNKNLTVINMPERDVYIEDKIGLKTLDKEGKLIVITVPGVSHFMWHTNETIITDYITPHLN